MTTFPHAPALAFRSETPRQSQQGRRRVLIVAAIIVGLGIVNETPAKSSPAALVASPVGDEAKEKPQETKPNEKAGDQDDAGGKDKPGDNDDAMKPEDVPANPSHGQGGALGVFGDAKIMVKKAEREYRLVAPKSLDAKQAVPLVFAYHGLGDSKDLMPWYSRLSSLAESKGFVLAYPNAKHRFWPLLPQIARDDLAFFDALYDSLTSQYNIDLNRVYVVGMSNGGYFSHLLASERNDKIAAIVCHSGGLGPYAFKTIDVPRKYSVLVVHGAVDTIVNVTEGRRVRDAYLKWGHPVEYIEVPGWNHLWAAKKNDVIWDFLQKHPLAPAVKNGA